MIKIYCTLGYLIFICHTWWHQWYRAGWTMPSQDSFFYNSAAVWGKDYSLSIILVAFMSWNTYFHRVTKQLKNKCTHSRRTHNTLKTKSNVNPYVENNLFWYIEYAISINVLNFLPTFGLWSYYCFMMPQSLCKEEASLHVTWDWEVSPKVIFENIYFLSFPMTWEIAAFSPCMGKLELSAKQICNLLIYTIVKSCCILVSLFILHNYNRDIIHNVIFISNQWVITEGKDKH